MSKCFSRYLFVIQKTAVEARCFRLASFVLVTFASSKSAQTVELNK